MTEAQARLRRLREESGISISEICKDFKISESTWRRWEGQTSRGTEIPHVFVEYFKLRYLCGE